MTTTPRDRSPLPDPDRDRDVHAFGHDHQSGSLHRPATHDHTLHATHHDGVGPNALGNPSESHDDPVEPAAGGWGHRLLMLACCIPMLVVVFALVASGVAGAGSIIFALLCVGMMAAMMFMMPGGHRH